MRKILLVIGWSILVFIFGILVSNFFLSKPGPTNLDTSLVFESPTPSTAQSIYEDIRGKSVEEFKVVKVIDGDTITLESGEVVRYIGIDAPETGRECFSQESTDKNRELVLGKSVRLEKDVSETDRYKRLLRYIWVDDILVNDYLVREGYARASTYPPDVKYSNQFLEAEKVARENNRGLWSKCAGSATSSYTGEDKDCGDFVTHQEAQEFFISQGGPSSDPHKLDQDKDGLACESLP